MLLQSATIKFICRKKSIFSSWLHMLCARGMQSNTLQRSGILWQLAKMLGIAQNLSDYWCKKLAMPHYLLPEYTHQICFFPHTKPNHICCSILKTNIHVNVIYVLHLCFKYCFFSVHIHLLQKSIGDNPLKNRNTSFSHLRYHSIIFIAI